MDRCADVVVIVEEILLVLIAIAYQCGTPVDCLITVGLEGFSIGNGLEQSLDGEVRCIAIVGLQTIASPIVVDTTPRGIEQRIALLTSRALSREAVTLDALQVDRLGVDLRGDDVAVLELVEAVFLQTVHHSLRQILDSLDFLTNQTRTDEYGTTVTLAGKLKATLVDDSLEDGTLFGDEGIDITLT